VTKTMTSIMVRPAYGIPGTGVLDRGGRIVAHDWNNEVVMSSNRPGRKMEESQTTKVMVVWVDVESDHPGRI